MSNSNSFEIWSDGSCLDNNPKGGPGGYAVVALYGDLQIEISKGFYKTTNNRMEIMAVLEALSQLQERTEVKVYTDSQYTIDAVTKWVYGWMKRDWKTRNDEDVKNKDLFQKLYALCRFHKVEFIKVKAHVGVPLNERCDVLAKAAARAPTDDDVGFIPKA